MSARTLIFARFLRTIAASSLAKRALSTLRRATLALALLSWSGLAAKDEHEGAQLDLRFELLETTYRFENDGSGQITNESRISILTRAGCDQLGKLPLLYSGQLEELTIDYVRTLKKDGSRIDADSASVMESTPSFFQDTPILSDVRVKVIVPSKLEPGDQLAFRTTKVIRAPLKRGDFWAAHPRHTSRAVKKELVVLDVPAGRKLSFKPHPNAHYSLLRENHRIKYRWELDVSNEAEEDEPARELFLVSSLENWNDVATWYESLQAGRRTITSEIRDLAAKLMGGKSLTFEKVAALYAYVAQSIRYLGLEFGIGGYQARAAADVLRSGYGDCKDKAGLLITLLAAIGVKAYPALVKATPGPIEPAVSMPAQFNHVIVAVQLDRELLWIDPTLELARMGLLAPELRGKAALLIEPGRARLEMIPERSPVPNREKLIAKGKLDGAGKLELSNELELSGVRELASRILFRVGNENTRKAYFENIAASQAAGGGVDDWKSSETSDLDGSFKLSYRLVRPGFFGVIERGIAKPFPLALISEDPWSKQLDRFKIKDQLPLGKKPRFETDLKLDFGVVEESLELELDPTYQPDVPSGIHLDRSFASYESSYSFEGGWLKARRILTVKQSRLPAAQWSELSELQDRINQDLGQKLTLRRTRPIDLRSQMDQLSADDLNRGGANALDKDKDFPLARDLLLKATEKEPKHKYAWNNLGRAYLSMQILDEAERAFKKQIELNPKDNYAYNNLGRVYRFKNQDEAAIQQFKKQLEIDPLDSYAIPNLAEEYSRLGRWRESAETWQRALALKQDQSRYYVSLAHALIMAGNIEDARASYPSAGERP